MDEGFREKKIKDPRKEKTGREFSIFDELDELDQENLPDYLNDFEEENANES